MGEEEEEEEEDGGVRVDGQPRCWEEEEEEEAKRPALCVDDFSPLQGIQRAKVIYTGLKPPMEAAARHTSASRSERTRRRRRRRLY